LNHAKYQILELKTINFFGGLKRLVLVDCSLSWGAANDRGCVKTLLSATDTQNRTGNRASTRNPHLLTCR